MSARRRGGAVAPGGAPPSHRKFADRPYHGDVAPRTNFQLARIFGIRIGVGISWFAVLFFFIFAVTGPFHEMLGGSRTTAYLVAVASVLSFFASLIMHELGHALVARRNGTVAVSRLRLRVRHASHSIACISCSIGGRSKCIRSWISPLDAPRNMG